MNEAEKMIVAALVAQRFDQRTGIGEYPHRDTLETIATRALAELRRGHNADASPQEGDEVAKWILGH